MLSIRKIRTDKDLEYNPNLEYDLDEPSEYL